MEKQNKKLLSVTVLLICLAGMVGIAVADGEKASAPQEEKETADRLKGLFYDWMQNTKVRDWDEVLAWMKQNG